MLDRDYYSISIVLMSIGILIDTIHSLFYYQKYYSSQGIFHIDIIHNKRDKGLFSRILSFLIPVINERVFVYILLVRLVLSIGLIISPQKFSSLIFVVFILQLLFNVRNKLGLSGADQMRTIFLFGLSVMSFPSAAFFNIGMLFIIVQLYISYFFTAYNKFISPVWRKGSALILVFNNDLFGNKFIQNLLVKSGMNINKCLCWGIILFQLTFPVFGSISYTVPFILAAGIMFHLALAATSNLNDFFWTFVSAYPLVYYFANHGIHF